jgi:hypothetical protein
MVKAMLEPVPLERNRNRVARSTVELIASGRPQASHDRATDGRGGLPPAACPDYGWPASPGDRRARGGDQDGRVAMAKKTKKDKKSKKSKKK